MSFYFRKWYYHTTKRIRCLLGSHFRQGTNPKPHIDEKMPLTKLKIFIEFYVPIPNRTLKKVLLFNMLLKPSWTQGIQLWSSASKSEIDRIQKLQSETLRAICRAPWNVKNSVIHHDLEINTVTEQAENPSSRQQSNHCLFRRENLFGDRALSHPERYLNYFRRHFLLWLTQWSNPSPAKTAKHQPSAWFLQERGLRGHPESESLQLHRHRRDSQMVFAYTKYNRCV